MNVTLPETTTEAKQRTRRRLSEDVILEQIRFAVAPEVNHFETFLVRGVRSIYLRLLPLAVRNARRAAAIAVAFLVLVGILGARLGTEFLPKLEEGNMWIRAVMPPTINLESGM